jgi:hypothetical protein
MTYLALFWLGQIFGFKVDPFVGENVQHFYETLTLNPGTGKRGGCQGVLCCAFFLIGILTIEQKTRKHDFKKSHFGLMTTLLLTVQR